MNVVEQTDKLIELAQAMGYQVRYDYFGGTGGGFCQVNGKKWLFIDLALNGVEQLEYLQKGLSEHPEIVQFSANPFVQSLLKAA